MNQTNICKFSNFQSGDLICSQFIFETTDAQNKNGTSPFHLLGIVSEGTGKLELSEQTLTLSIGDVFLIPQGQSFRIRRGDRLAYFYLGFHGRRAEELLERLHLAQEGASILHPQDCQPLLAFGFECLKKSAPHTLDLFGESFLLYVFGHLIPSQSADCDLISQMISETNKRFSDPSFSLSVLAEELNYSSKYLSFYFKKKKNICYSDYLRDLRIRHAVFYMEQGVVSVKNVALLSGFQDPLYFSKIFNKVMGCSPKAYMDRLKI